MGIWGRMADQSGSFRPVVDQRAKLVDPATNRLAAHQNAALRHQFLDIPDAQGKAEIQPDGMSDRIWREPVTLERDWLHRFPWIGPILGLEAETS